MADNRSQPGDWETFLSGISQGKTVKEYSANRTIIRQGDPADSVFFLRRGAVKLAVTSKQGKEAIVAVLNAGEFFGEGCLAGNAKTLGSFEVRLRNWTSREAAIPAEPRPEEGETLPSPYILGADA